MSKYRNRLFSDRSGFTLVEVVVTASLLVVTITLAMVGLGYLLSESHKGIKQTELDIEVQLAMERLKRDLRLSSLDQMYYFPEGQGPYTALSFPLAQDSDGDGILDVDATGALIWGQQLVYHIKVGTPNELRVTTFNNRLNLTDAQRQAQLNSVVAVGSGAATFNAGNSSTRTIFANLFDWSLAPLDAVFDGYSRVYEREINVMLGSVSLTGGVHTLRFQVLDRNPDSSGYRMGIDTLFASPSYSIREAEDLLPASDQSGATASRMYMPAGSWSGNHHMYFGSGNIGNYVEIEIYNDAWVETNFRATGETHDNTVVEFHPGIRDYVVQLAGNTTNWTALNQTGALSGYSSTSNEVSGCAVRVLVRGEEMDSGNWISDSGGRCRIKFTSGSGDLRIRDAFIAEASSSTSNTVDSISSTMTRITFGGSDGITLSNSSRWSDLVNLNIDRSKSYHVTYLVDNANDRGWVRKWDETHNSAFYGTAIIPNASNPVEADARAAQWSSRGDVLVDNKVYGVAEMYVTYVTNGVYTSSIFDTQHEAPSYNRMNWRALTPTNSSVRLKVRSASDAGMTNATSWASLSAMTSGGAINPGSDRYIQFQAELNPAPMLANTPLLRDVTIDWPGNEQFVEIGGTFSKGPDFGILELTVNGQDIKKGLEIDLEIFDFVRAHGAEQRITSRLVAEVFPRNTGK